MENRLSSYDIKNLIRRISSAILFIPFIIVPIILKGYLLYLFYIFLLTLMVIELIEMSKISKKKTFIYLYLSICILTVFTFILLISSSGNGNLKIIEIILTIWIFDTFCYLGGNLFNGKKLMPNISKGKTFNGLYSDIFVTLIISGLYYSGTHSELFMSLLLVVIVIILSFLGDLIVSVLKRSVNIKDSGYIMPGHGGIIDRMDSFVFVFFFFGIYTIIFVK